MMAPQPAGTADFDQATQPAQNQCETSSSALRIESDGMRINPECGLSNSSIIMIPPETATAQRKSVIIAVKFGGANNPKLVKTMVNQNTRRIRNGTGILCPMCCSSDHRA